MTARFRFAPSPTGGLHIGTARTALFNWLAARSMGGKLILRIEDTDIKRSDRNYEKSIIKDLKWLGLDWDEFYRQSERTEIYKKLADELLNKTKAYRCFCSQERLESLKRKQYSEGRMSKYDNRCRNLTGTDIEKNLKQGKKYVIRFKVEDDREITFNDLIREKISFNSKVIGDFIIIKSDGTPSYNFAVVADDGEMKITHVLRGEDHITNTARQILLFDSLGFKTPFFAHLSMIMGEDGSKLSKRHGSTTISQFREQGYIAEAVANYLSALSWAPGEDNEIFGINEILSKFKITGISKSPAVFDINKLKWLNGIYIRRKSAEELAKICIPYLIKEGIVNKKDLEDKKIVEKTVRSAAAFQDNLKTLSDLPLYAGGFFKEKITGYSGDAEDILKLETSKTVLRSFLDELECELNSFDNSKDMDFNEKRSRELIDKTGKNLKDSNIKGKYLYMPMRVSITGKTHGPELWKVILMLGLKNCIQRVKQTLEYIKNNKL